MKIGTQQLEKEADEYLPAFIDRIAPELRNMSDSELEKFMGEHFPLIKFPKVGKYEIKNPYTGKLSVVDRTQASVCNFILNYESVRGEDHKVKVQELERTCASHRGNGEIEMWLEVERSKAALLEDWNAARYLVMALWYDLYRDQID